MRNRNQPIAVEGYPFIALFAFITLIMAMLSWVVLTIIALALTLFSVYFFRNPERVAPSDNSAVISPADGKIVFAGPVKEERYLHRDMLKVSVFMSVFNVHVNRAPCNGKVIDRFYNKGSFFNASLDKASLQNEQSGMVIEMDNGSPLLMIQIAGLIARRIITYPVVGDILKTGIRCGLIRFGSRVDIFLPTNYVLKVRLDDKVVAGETIIGLPE